MNQFYRREPRTNIWPVNQFYRREPRTNIWHWFTGHAIYHKSSPPRDRSPEWAMDRSPVIEPQKWGPMETGHATPGDRPWDRAGKRPHAGARRRVRTVLANPGVKCSPDLPRGLRRVSESAPINRRRVDRHRRCIRPTRAGDSIDDKSHDR
jgi:hypothetical protein